MANEMVLTSMDDLQHRLDEITQQVQKENDEKTALEKAKTDIAKGMADYQKNKEAADKESTDATTLIADISAQCKDKEVVQALLDARTKVQGELDDLKDKLVAKQDALSGPQTAADAANTALKTKKQALDDAQAALVDLSKQIAAATKRLADFKKAAKDALTKCDCVLSLILQHDIQQVQAELSNLTSDAYKKQLWTSFSEAYKAYSAQVPATSDAQKALLTAQHEVDVAQKAVDDKIASFNDDVKNAAKDKAKC